MFLTPNHFTVKKFTFVSSECEGSWESMRMHMLHVYPCTHMNTCTHTYAQAHAYMHTHRHMHTQAHT